LFGQLLKSLTLKEFSLTGCLLRRNSNKLKSYFGQPLSHAELLGNLFTRDHFKLPIVVAITDDDDPNEDDDGMWCYCHTAKGWSMIGCENPLCTIAMYNFIG